MSKLISNAMVMSVLVAFIGSYPQRHMRVVPLPCDIPVVSDPKTNLVDVWYLPAHRFNLHDLPDWPADDAGDATNTPDYVQPAWMMFAATSVFAFYTMFYSCYADKFLMMAVTKWSLPPMGVITVLVYLRSYGGRFSLRLLFAVVTLLGWLLGMFRML